MKINNNIEEDYVSFEVAKLLKEKGFNVPCSTHWDFGNGDMRNSKPAGVHIGGFMRPREYTNSELMDTYTDKEFEGVIFGEFSRPTQSIATKWIRENFKIHIFSQPIYYEDRNKIAYFYVIYQNPEKEIGNHGDRFSDILNKSHQDVPGKYINEELFDKFIFEDKFAFHTSEEAINVALIECLSKIELWNHVIN